MKATTALSASLSLFALQSVYACFMMIPLDALVRDNPLIITGEIIEIEVAKPTGKENDRLEDIGYIRVDSVLKNKLGNHPVKVGERIPLKFPSANNMMVISTDIPYRKGQNGVWILEFRQGGFYATYPGDFQPLEKVKEIEEILKTVATK